MIEILKQSYGINSPIFIDDMVNISGHSRARVNQLVKELVANNQLAKFSDGIYYIPTVTMFGNSILDPRTVITRKYLQDDSGQIGIYSGMSLLSFFGVTNQVPSSYEIVTNNEATRVRSVAVGNLQVKLRRSRIKINNENYKVYQLLELMNQLDVKENFPPEKIVQYIKDNNIKYADIAKYLEYFPAKVSKNLNRGGVLYATV